MEAGDVVLRGGLRRKAGGSTLLVQHVQQALPRRLPP